MPDLRDQLVSAGLSPAEAEAKQSLFQKAVESLHPAGKAARSARVAWFVAGRLEVCGKHTDYAGGRSLLAAVEKGFCVVARSRQDAEVNLCDANSRERVSFYLSTVPGPEQNNWPRYAVTVIRRIAGNFPSARVGSDIAFASDLPAAAGLSSSSALIIAVFQALSDANALQENPAYKENIHSREDLAGYLAAIESGQNFGALQGDEGVGTTGGSEDHTAILCSAARELAQYSFCPTRKEKQIAVPPDCIFAIAASGIAAEKTGAALERYNRTAAAAHAVLELWRRATGRTDATLAAAVNSSPRATSRLRGLLAGMDLAGFSAKELRDRFEQFYEESENLVPGMSDAFTNKDWDALGQLSDRSQEAAEKLLGNQVPETAALARLARESGAYAASSFGAGFGGSVWALVSRESAGDFLHGWRERYRSQFPVAGARAAFFLTGAGPAALRLDLEA
ncbi:MAG TPA: galactokinase family protein [Candidatus Acidoferrales bacterium]|jgi:galactokinase|nr:galactokinase family protein [Candidatus Acidoferrales bacterium]